MSNAVTVKPKAEQAAESEKSTAQQVMDRLRVRTDYSKIMITDESQVLREGEKVVIPPSMKLAQAIVVLKNQMTYDEEPVNVKETIQGSFWDGAWALYRAMQRKFGWVQAVPIPSMFGSIKPELKSIPCNANESILVPIGRFQVPALGDDGYIETSHTVDDFGRVNFVMKATVLRKHERTIRELANIARQIVDEESIYRGKAIRMRFRDEDGNDLPMATPQFMDLDHITPKQLILPTVVKDAVETSIFTPIRQTLACLDHGIPLKRGILLSGPYGTGKTLCASVTAKYAQENGWTFIYCEKTEELQQAIRFAHQYQPCVLFCEDIDRTVFGDRTTKMDDVLNILDGIESKNAHLMVVLTTNHVDNINPAMLRPGRLDAIIEFQPPDAAAVEHLLRYYGKGLIEEGADLTNAGIALAGQIPAVVRECIERAKLSQIKIHGGKFNNISGAALHDAAESMKLQLSLLAAKPSDKPISQVIGEALLQTELREKVDKICEQF